MNDGSARDERRELERALAALDPDSPAREPILEALRALNAGSGDRPRTDSPNRPSRAVNDGQPEITSKERSGMSTGLKASIGAVAFVIVAGFAYFTQTAVVPSVIDEERSFAAGAIRSAGFELDVTTRPDGDVREGHVLDQEPRAGSRVRAGSAVRIVVSELPRFTLNGDFTLFATTGGTATNCYGEGGYDDIKSGVSVTVSDGTGRLLATGNLGSGTRSASGGSCSFSFRIPDIKQSDFYSIEVGRRGELSYSHAEMLASDWNVAFSLG